MSAAARQDSAGLPFIAEMYAVQLDQLAVLLDCSDRQARAAAGRWTERSLAESGQLGPARTGSG